MASNNATRDRNYDSEDNGEEHCEMVVKKMEDIDAEAESREAEDIVKERYGGVLPAVGIGMKNYMKAIEEIERKVLAGYYEEMAKKENRKKVKKYEKIMVKIRAKLDTLTNDEVKKKRYETILQKLQKKKDELSLSKTSSPVVK